MGIWEDWQRFSSLRKMFLSPVTSHWRQWLVSLTGIGSLSEKSIPLNKVSIVPILITPHLSLIKRELHEHSCKCFVLWVTFFFPFGVLQSTALCFGGSPGDFSCDTEQLMWVVRCGGQRQVFSCGGQSAWGEWQCLVLCFYTMQQHLVNAALHFHW